MSVARHDLCVQVQMNVITPPHTTPNTTTHKSTSLHGRFFPPSIKKNDINIYIYIDTVWIQHDTTGKKNIRV